MSLVGEGQRINQVNLEDFNFPALLKEVQGPPKTLFYIGELIKNELAVSIVGTRKASSDGLITAKIISERLAAHGFAIISGLALGIDAGAHEGALRAGGRTYAVLANGLDDIYPRQHENLGSKILKSGGGIFSEYPEGTPPYQNQFLERNRIIAGLSFATIVIEAPIHSGALVTAKYALEAGREVLVLPGGARNKNYEGSNMLLREGARLVRNADDILEDLEETIKNYPYLEKIDMKRGKESYGSALNNASHGIIIDIIKSASDGLGIDTIAEKAKLEPQVASQELTFLIIERVVEEKNGKFYLLNL